MLQAVLLIDAEKVRPYDSVWDICCLCSENVTCNGCYSDNCHDYAQCENRKCSIEKGFLGCYACEMDCKRGLLNKIKPYGFTEGIIGDYDEFDDVEMLIEFIKTGKRSN